MVRIQWKDRYNIAYKDIDEQHRRLLDILNELGELQGAQVDPERVAQAFRSLCDYALTHFATEERYLTAAEYPDLEAHKAEHAQFIHDLLSLDQSLEPGDPALAQAAYAFVKDWYLEHIIRSDQAYAPHLKSLRSRADVRGILLDLSGVVCHVDEDRFLAAVATLWGRPVDGARAMVEQEAELLRGYASGAVDTTAFLAFFAPWGESGRPDEPFTRAYTDVFTPVEPVLEVVRQLKGRFKVGLLADTTPLRWEAALRHQPWVEAFDAVTLPWTVGAVKPDPRLLEDLAGQLGVITEACVYVDDQAAYALVAAPVVKRGLTAASPEALVNQLERLRLLER